MWAGDPRNRTRHPFGRKREKAALTWVKAAASSHDVSGVGCQAANGRFELIPENTSQMQQLGADHIQAEWKHARDLAPKLQKTLDEYRGSDEQASTDVKDAGNGDGGDGLF